MTVTVLALSEAVTKLQGDVSAYITSTKAELAKMQAALDAQNTPGLQLSIDAITATVTALDNSLTPQATVTPV